MGTDLAATQRGWRHRSRYLLRFCLFPTDYHGLSQTGCCAAAGATGFILVPRIARICTDLGANGFLTDENGWARIWAAAQRGWRHHFFNGLFISHGFCRPTDNTDLHG